MSRARRDDGQAGAPDAEREEFKALKGWKPPKQKRELAQPYLRTILHERLRTRVLDAVRAWRVARGPMTLQGARIAGARITTYTTACDALDAAFAALDKYEREHT